MQNIFVQHSSKIISLRRMIFISTSQKLKLEKMVLQQVSPLLLHLYHWPWTSLWNNKSVWQAKSLYQEKLELLGASKKKLWVLKD